MAILKSQITIAGSTKEAPPAIKSEALKVDISTAIAAEAKAPAVQQTIEQMMPEVEGPAGRFGEESGKPDVAASVGDALAGDDEQTDDGGLGHELSMEDDRSISLDDAVAMIEADGAGDDDLDLASALPGYRSEAEIDALTRAGLQDQKGDHDSSLADSTGGAANASGDGVGGGQRSEGDLLSLHEQKDARDGGSDRIAEGTGFADAMTNFIISKTEGAESSIMSTRICGRSISMPMAEWSSCTTRASSSSFRMTAIRLP